VICAVEAHTVTPFFDRNYSTSGRAASSAAKPASEAIPDSRALGVTIGLISATGLTN
jgi:hypothetical protein